MPSALPVEDGAVDRRPIVIRLELRLEDNSLTGRASEGAGGGAGVRRLDGPGGGDRCAGPRRRTGRGRLTEGEGWRSSVVNRAVRYGDDPEFLKAAPMCADNHEGSTSMLCGSQRKGRIRMRTGPPSLSLR